MNSTANKPNMKIYLGIGDVKSIKFYCSKEEMANILQRKIYLFGKDFVYSKNIRK